MPLTVTKKRRHDDAIDPNKVSDKPRRLYRPDGTIDAEALLGESLESLKAIKLKLSKRPMIGGEPLEPVFPANLADCSLIELGTLLGQYTQMAGYAEAQLALMDTRYQIAKHNEKITQTLQTLKSPGKTVKAREAQGLAHEDTIRNTVLHFKKLADSKLTRAVLEDYVRKQKAISREITRRSGIEARDTTDD